MRRIREAVEALASNREEPILPRDPRVESILLSIDGLARNANAIGELALAAEAADLRKALKNAAEPAPAAGAPPAEPAADPFDDPRMFGPELRVEFEVVHESIIDVFRGPAEDSEPWFWKSVRFQAGVDDEGGRRWFRRLPFAGTPDRYLSWIHPGMTISTDVSGAHAEDFEIGMERPARHSISLACLDPERKKIRVVEHRFLTAALRGVRFWSPEPGRPRDGRELDLRFHSTTVRLGKLPWGLLTIRDENANGAFNDEATLAEGGDPLDSAPGGSDSLEAEPGIRVPLGSLFRGPKGVFYSLSRLDPGGTSAVVRAYRGPVGRVCVPWKPSWHAELRRLVIGVETGGGRAGFFDVASADSKDCPIEVPAGIYSLKWGQVGWRSYEATRVEILKGRSRSIRVAPGRLTEIALGGPFEVRIPVSLSGVSGEVRTWEMQVSGRNGEEYRRFYGETVRGDFKVLDVRRRLLFEGSLAPLAPDEELPDTPAGIGILAYPKPVRFTSSVAAPDPPARVEAKGALPLLGEFETEGWKR
jgi:hypothetical protein